MKRVLGSDMFLIKREILLRGKTALFKELSFGDDLILKL